MDEASAEILEFKQPSFGPLVNDINALTEPGKYSDEGIHLYESEPLLPLPAKAFSFSKMDYDEVTAEKNVTPLFSDEELAKILASHGGLKQKKKYGPYDDELNYDSKKLHLVGALKLGNLLKIPTCELPCEEALVSGFESMLEGMQVADIAVPSPNRAISNIDGFEFTPVVASSGNTSSMHDASYFVRVKDGIRTTYGKFGNGEPYVDTRQAIGLAYNGHLIALGAAGLDEDGVLLIKQIQDVTGVRKDPNLLGKIKFKLFAQVTPEVWRDPEESKIAGAEVLRKAKKELREHPDHKRYLGTGLHEGILWRETLVRAWEEVAEQIGATGVSIQSNQNNRWQDVRDAEVKSYDVLAQRMGYVFDNETKNWVKPNWQAAV